LSSMSTPTLWPAGSVHAPNRKPPPPRQPRPGEDVWRLRNGAGRTQTCELR
jgi:hypothetical protein